MSNLASKLLDIAHKYELPSHELLNQHIGGYISIPAQAYIDMMSAISEAAQIGKPLTADRVRRLVNTDVDDADSEAAWNDFITHGLDDSLPVLRLTHLLYQRELHLAGTDKRAEIDNEIAELLA